MSTKEQVTQVIESLDEDELQQVAEFLAFLKFRSRFQGKLFLDTTRIAEFYAGFSDEDRRMAEEGIEAYAQGLLAEDTL